MDIRVRDVGVDALDLERVLARSELTMSGRPSASTKRTTSCGCIRQDFPFVVVTAFGLVVAWRISPARSAKASQTVRPARGAASVRYQNSIVWGGASAVGCQ